MTQFATTHTAFDSVGIKEDLQDTIFTISPTDTDLISGLNRGKASQHLHEWQTDSLAAATTANAHIEADDIASFPALTPTVRVGNRLQISRKLILISDSLEQTDRAGRGSEESYQVAKKGKELKRDMETIVFANLAGAAGSTTVARQMATLGAWLKSNTSIGATGGDPVYTDGVPAAARTDATAGDMRAFTSTILNDIVQQGWTAGADIDAMTLYCGPVNKTKVSAFTGIVTKNYDISTPKPSAIIVAADVYVSNFGVLKVKANRWMRERDAYGIDKKFLSLAFLRPMKTVKLAKTGDAEKRMLLCEWTLRVHNEAALMGAFDLTTT
jgi:hypothetical protein